MGLSFLRYSRDQTDRNIAINNTGMEGIVDTVKVMIIDKKGSVKVSDIAISYRTLELGSTLS